MWINSIAQDSQSYTLFSNSPNGLAWSASPFEIETSPIAHSFCGDISYSASYSGASLSDSSSPITFLSSSLQLGIYSEDTALIGDQIITLNGWLTDYQVEADAESSPITLTVFDPCLAPQGL